jgi:hypothetical protein
MPKGVFKISFSLELAIIIRKGALLKTGVDTVNFKTVDYL